MIYYYEKYCPEQDKVLSRGFCLYNFHGNYIDRMWEFEEYDCPNIVVPILNKDNPFIDKEGFIATEEENPDYEVDDYGEPLNDDEEPYIKTYHHLRLYTVAQNLIPMIKGMTDELCYTLCYILVDTKKYTRFGKKLQECFKVQIERHLLEQTRRLDEVRNELNGLVTQPLARG